MKALPSVDRVKVLAAKAKTLAEVATKRLKETEKHIRTLEFEERQLGYVAELFRKLIDMEITNGVKAVEKLLSDGLQAVFDDQDLRVRADVDVSRGKVSVDLVTIHKRKDGSEVEGLSVDAFGGSVTTVQSVLLRVIIILQRGMRKALFLDESLPAFDADYITNVGRFLSVLCARLDLDALVITHNPALVDAVPHSYKIVRHDNGSRFEVIS